ncbi:MAG TPA: hypothetical protein VE986_05455 [Hyphomicrobiales bacterium]|nr:hypothetical protein [Hyphomicrobiales bacterium]
MSAEPINPKPSFPAAGSSLRSPIARLPSASIYLSAVILLCFADIFAGWHFAALAAIPFLAAYFAKVWRVLMANGRILLGACAAVAAIAAFQPGAVGIIGAGASRMIYLPAFVALLGLLRAAAAASKAIAVAGHYLVSQPPRTRYIALSFGGHFFGILLNVGGLALLVEMVRDANTLEAAGGDPNIVAWRERRMTVAMLRGFAAMAFWTPLGVSFNLLLVSVPGVNWADAGPIGILCAVAFIGLGWVFDQFQRPKGLRPRPLKKVPGGAKAMTLVVGHVAMVSLVTWAIEYMLPLSFQTALLLSVPGYAFLWAFFTRLSHSDPAPLKNSAALLVERGIAAFPAYANEVAVFAASGFLGAAVVALIPQEALRGFFLSLSLPVGVLAALLCFSVAFLGIIGLNPMIAATIIASAVASAEIPGLPKPAIVLAIAAGWACTVVASPMNSALVMTAALVRRQPWTLAAKWNGWFALAALLLSMAVLVAVLSVL